MLEKARQSVEDGSLVTELMQRVHCVAMALKTWTLIKMLQLAMNSKFL